MSMVHRFANWLETHWVIPAYSGWVLAAFSICFLASAINTMAGWLYVISGISFALLGIAALLPVRSLRGIRVQRRPIDPVSSGDRLTIELEIQNQSKDPKTLLQFQDMIPFVLGQPIQRTIETIAPQETYRWIYYQPTQQRGVYRWYTMQLRTATPLGLFWCRRHRHAPATAIVYPTVLPLVACPLVDEMGQEDSPEFHSRDRRSNAANENITRSLRPYRWGDPIRLVHWRTSARYGQLRVRELEVFTGGQEVVICLDSAHIWQQQDFEQAVIAAASLYFYAARRQLNTRLWTADTGLLQGYRVVLEALASVNPGEEPSKSGPPNRPLIWLTQNPLSINTLPAASRWVLWPSASPTEQKNLLTREHSGILINPEQPLHSQLQSPLR
ncbi:DUF58 domain-containing protein [Aerosakkonema sp. BLCC-F183]|uniref:DUF58 domain-containing protein n=1 Tax=Aerosakkonema sp. BLCC-F183 TaxID=3342834 RepID=UPI0035BAA97C